MNNQVIKLRANTNHFGHPVTSHDHPAPPVRQPLTHSDGVIGDGAGQQPAGKTSDHQPKGEAKARRALAEQKGVKNVLFSFNHSSAKKVQIAGEFTEWEKKPIGMKANKDGSWQATVALPPGRHRYRLLVDGQWQDDQNASERVSNPFGTCDCVIEVK